MGMLKMVCSPTHFVKWGKLELVTENMCCWILCANMTGLYMFVRHVRNLIVRQQSSCDYSSCQSVTIEMAN